ncbi:unnamed protein product [Rotaria sp. Silwood2]|nr:unnamed protein product [Rotaria sp. Silwood2]
MATSLYPPLRIRDIPGPQPGQFGVLEKPYRPHKNLVAITKTSTTEKKISFLYETKHKINAILSNKSSMSP